MNELTASPLPEPVHQAPGDHVHWTWWCPKPIGGCGYRTFWNYRTEADAQQALDSHRQTWCTAAPSNTSQPGASGPPPAASPSPNWSSAAPHAVYLDAVVAELMAAAIPPRRVTLATHYDSAQEPLRAGLEWDHETDLLSYNHWPRGLTVLWDDSYGWDHVGPGGIPLDPISPPQTVAAAIRHLMAHGPGSVHRDRTEWEHAHLLTAISRDRATHLPHGFWPPDPETTPCP